MFATAVLVGGAFGAKHAFEADHLAAVATLVADEPRPAATGAAWGIGHSVPILAIGGLFVALNIQLPSTVGTAFEVLVAVMLVGLGARVIADREPLGTSLLQHSHGGRSGTVHRHLRLAGKRIGLGHTHTDRESFAVGIVHGLAGSGGVVVALAAAAPTNIAGAGFLVGFAAASIVAMAIASWGCGRGIERVGRLRLVAGAVSVAVGLLLVADVARSVLPL